MKKKMSSEVKEPTRNGRVRAVKARARREKPEHGTSLMTAFREIRELIVHGRMSPGTWIVEADLAERLNMSRTPVRAAVHWLQREGYVLEHRSVSKSRMIVAPLTKEDANELYMIIGRLEGIAGRGAAALPETRRKDLVKELRRFNEALDMIATGRGGQSTDIFELDRSFHRTIVHAGAGARLTTLHSAIEPQAERYWRLYASSIIKDLQTSVLEHKRIIDALARGDADEMEAGLKNNWSKGAERLGHVIDIFGERGSW